MTRINPLNLPIAAGTEEKASTIVLNDVRTEVSEELKGKNTETVGDNLQKSSSAQTSEKEKMEKAKSEVKKALAKAKLERNAAKKAYEIAKKEEEAVIAKAKSISTQEELDKCLKEYKKAHYKKSSAAKIRKYSNAKRAYITITTQIKEAGKVANDIKKGTKAANQKFLPLPEGQKPIAPAQIENLPAPVEKGNLPIKDLPKYEPKFKPIKGSGKFLKYAAIITGVGMIVSCIGGLFNVNRNSADNTTLGAIADSTASDTTQVDTTQVATPPVQNDSTQTDSITPGAVQQTEEVTPEEKSDEVTPEEELQQLQQETENEDAFTWIVKPGDNVWNIVKGLLKNEKHIENPTNKQIAEGVKKLLEENGLHYEADGYHVMIRPDDKIKYKTL